MKTEKTLTHTFFPSFLFFMNSLSAIEKDPEDLEDEDDEDEDYDDDDGDGDDDGE